MKQYLINNYTQGLDLKIKHIKFLASKNITKIFSIKQSMNLDNFKTLLLQELNFKEGYFKTIEKAKKEQLCITPITDYDEQYVVLFIPSSKVQKAHYLNIKDPLLRSNKHVINALRNYSYFSIVEVEEPNLSHVTITYDLKSNKENLVATYKIPGGKIPFYIHKLH